MIAFYYLLRFVEYTAPKRQGRKPRTKLFSVNDVTFFKMIKNCGFLSPLPLNASKKYLLSEVADKLRINEQKNSFKGACLHLGGRSFFRLTLTNIWGIIKGKDSPLHYPWNYPCHFSGTSFKGNDRHL